MVAQSDPGVGPLPFRPDARGVRGPMRYRLHGNL